MNMLDSMGSVDFVLSRGPSYANDGETPTSVSNRLGENARY